EVLAALQPLVPTDLLPLQPGRAQYTVLLNPEGGIIDDLIIYAQGPETATIIANAATTQKDAAWLRQHLSEKGVEFSDVSRDRALVAVQGPQAIATVQPLLANDPGQLLAFGHVETTLDGAAAFVARTGYTGEDGVEVMIPAEIAPQVWERLLAAGVEPCGLGARDTLRLEAAMGLYGQDMNDETTPLEAGLGWLVHLDRKGDFIGRSVLERQKAEGIPKKLVGLEMNGRHIARHDYPIQHEGETVGIVTSGTLAPTVGKAIALGYVPTALAKPGRELEVTIRGKNYPAKVVKKPFYRTSAPAPRA
ncbi:MAG: glycine cleavage system aminomethyltransferase GcvT, partial [Cyanobacteria bacterium J06641_5]